MYKKLILIVLLAVLTAGIARAQLFIGGSVGLGIDGGSTTYENTTTDAPSVFTIDFSPKVGFNLNKDFAIGAYIGIGRTSSSWTGNNGGGQNPGDDDYDWDDFLKAGADDDGSNVAHSRSTLSWEFGAFARYRMVKASDLSLHIEGALGLGGGSSSRTDGSTTTDYGKTSTFGIGILPVLEYELTRNLSLEASCGLLNLGFKTTTTYPDPSKTDIYSSSTNFGFGVNQNSPAFNVGIMFKF